MFTSEKSTELRIVIISSIIGLTMVGLVALETYSQDIKQHFSKKMVELMPDLDHSLAAL